VKYKLKKLIRECIPTEWKKNGHCPPPPSPLQPTPNIQTQLLEETYSRLWGWGMPWVIMVLSNATTGCPACSAALISSDRRKPGRQTFEFQSVKIQNLNSSAQKQKLILDIEENNFLYTWVYLSSSCRKCSMVLLSERSLNKTSAEGSCC
jgi:hypothetical protein